MNLYYFINWFETYKVKFLFLLLCVSLNAWSNNHEYDYCKQLITTGEKELESGLYSKSMERFKTAKVLAEKNNWVALNYAATIDIGAAFYLILDYSESLKSNIEAYKIALEHQLGKERETRALNNITGVYFKDANYEKAKEFLLKAYQNASTEKDSISIGRYASNLALINNKTNDLDTAEIYLNIAFKVLQNYPQYKIMPQKVALEQAYLSHNYVQATQFAKTILSNDSLSDADKANAYMYLAKINKNNNQLSIYYAQQANISADWETKSDIYRLLSEVYQKNNDLAASLIYKDSLILAIDSVNQATNKRMLESNRIKFEIFNYQKTISENEEALRHQKRISLYAFIICLLIILITTLILWYLFLQNKQKKKLYECDKRIIKLELEKKEKDKLLLEKQINELEITARLEQEKTDKKNRELTAKALFLASQNQLIEEIIDFLSSIEKTKDTTPVTRQIQHLKLRLKDSSKYDNFLLHFEEVNRNFLNTLQQRHSNLTSNDIRFLSYIYINLNTKEISSLLNITTDSCKRKKIRISQKLGLDTSSSLYDYISGICPK